MAPKHSAEVLSTVPKHKEAGMCLTEKICLLGKFYSGTSCSAISLEFNVNESTKYI